MAKVFTGKVVSTKMNKTITVLVERKIRHPFYKKVIIRHKKFKVHNEDLDLKEGDLVSIRETRPISKDKHFIVVQKIS
jgi:small subunit ribosomal protein S17